jgi:deoxyribodipyrimidine photo-lyase
VAGTGKDTRPNRVLNPIRQARRFDPKGTYVRRFVPELTRLRSGTIHEPWKVDVETRAGLDYPDPLVDP